MATQNVIGKNLVYTNEADGYTISGGNSTRTITITGNSVTFSSLISNLTGTSSSSYSINKGGAGGILYFDSEVGMSLSGSELTIGMPSHTIVIAGNLTVNGTTTTINTETINLADNIIVLNSNYSGSDPTEDGGIEVQRGTLDNASLLWDESENVWKAGIIGSEVEIANVSSAQTLTNKTLGAGSVWNGSAIGSSYINLAMSNLTDVSVGAVANGQVLQYQSGTWVPFTLASGHSQNTDIGTTSTEFTIDINDDAYETTEKKLKFGAGAAGYISYKLDPMRMERELLIYSSDQVLIQAGTGRIMFRSGAISGASWQGSVIGPTYGGTGQTAYALGDILYASAANTLAKLAGNTTATKRFLRQTGTGTASAAPAWDTISKADVGLGNVENTALSTWAGSANITAVGTISSGTWQGTVIGTTYGGTGQSSYTAGDMLYYASGAALSKLAKGTSNQILGMNAAASAPEYKSISGTGGTTITHGVRTITINSHAAGSDTGTTNESFSINSDGSATTESASLLFGNSTTHYVRWNSTTSRIELSHAATLTAGSGSVWNGSAISAAYGGTSQSTWASGDMLYASAANTLSKLTIGTTGQVLTVSSGMPTWSDAPNISGTPSDTFTINTDATSEDISTLKLGPYTGASISATPWGNITVAAGQDNIITLDAERIVLGPPERSLEINRGTISSGTWHGDVISVAFGGTNLDTLGSSNQLLGVNSAGTALEYKSMTWVSSWVEVTTASAAAAANTAYVTNSTSRVAITLPSTASFGTIVKIIGKGTGGWRLSQGAGQTIYFGESNTTTGATGYISSTHMRDCVEVVCIGANTTWQVVSSVGNITFA